MNVCVSNRCRSCNNYRDPCPGKERACKDWTPINLDGPTDTGIEADEPASEPTEAPDEPETTTESVETDPEQESKHEKFTRLLAKRLPKTLDELRKLKNLTAYYERRRGGKCRVYNYEWTGRDTENLLHTLRQAVDDLETGLMAEAENREGGLI